MRTLRDLVEALRADSALFKAVLEEVKARDEGALQALEDAAPSNLEVIATKLAGGELLKAAAYLHSLMSTCIALGWMLAREEDKP